MWQDGKYIEVGDVICEEEWPPKRVAEFCVYVYRYLGTNQLDILYKFM